MRTCRTSRVLLTIAATLALTAATTHAGPAESHDVGSGGIAVAPPGAVTCKDGSQAKPGRGACSHHGGVASAGAAAAPAPANETAPSATGANQATSGKGGKHSDPTGATAQCKDGTYSHSHKQSACSHHGGVEKRL